MSLVTILLLYLADHDAMASANRHTCSAWRKGGNRSVKRQSLSELLSTDLTDWQWATHPRLIFLRSQCFMSELPPCHGAMDNKGLCLWCRRGLLAYVYNGVFVWMHALVAGSGSYIVRPCGHDLHGPTKTTIFLTMCGGNADKKEHQKQNGYSKKILVQMCT